MSFGTCTVGSRRNQNSISKLYIADVFLTRNHTQNEGGGRKKSLDFSLYLRGLISIRDPRFWPFPRLPLDRSRESGWGLLDGPGCDAPAGPICCMGWWGLYCSPPPRDRL